MTVEEFIEELEAIPNKNAIVYGEFDYDGLNSVYLS